MVLNLTFRRITQMELETQETGFLQSIANLRNRIVVALHHKSNSELNQRMARLLKFDVCPVEFHLGLPHCNKIHISCVETDQSIGSCKNCYYKVKDYQLKQSSVREVGFMDHKKRFIAFEATATYCPRCGRVWIHSLVPINKSDHFNVFNHMLRD